MGDVAPNLGRLMGKADIHIHSDYSDGMATVAQILEFVEYRTDLDLIAVTDHDMFDGAEAAMELAANRNYRFRVLPGIEVTTLEGHLLALNIFKPVPSLKPLNRTIAEIHAQGGIAVLPHPMSWLIRSVGQHGILRIKGDPAPEVYFDGIEAMNPSVAGRVTVAKTKALNANLFHLPETGGSDAHTLEMIGTGITRFPGSTVDEFLMALQENRTTSDGHFWTREEIRQLARIGPRQMARSLFVLPGRHLRRMLEPSFDKPRTLR